MDLFATVLEMNNVAPPRGRDLDSTSLLNNLINGTETKRLAYKFISYSEFQILHLFLNLLCLF